MLYTEQVTYYTDHEECYTRVRNSLTHFQRKQLANTLQE